MIIIIIFTNYNSYYIAFQFILKPFQYHLVPQNINGEGGIGLDLKHKDNPKPQPPLIQK